MATNGTWLKIDEQHAVPDLQGAANSLDRADSELVLDCSAMQRLDATAIASLEALANKADQHEVKVVLHGVTVRVYKVLRLLKLTSRFSFTN